MLASEAPVACGASSTRADSSNSGLMKVAGASSKGITKPLDASGECPTGKLSIGKADESEAGKPSTFPLTGLDSVLGLSRFTVGRVDGGPWLLIWGVLLASSFLEENQPKIRAGSAAAKNNVTKRQKNMSKHRTALRKVTLVQSALLKIYLLSPIMI